MDEHANNADIKRKKADEQSTEQINIHIGGSPAYKNGGNYFFHMI